MSDETPFYNRRREDTRIVRLEETQREVLKAIGQIRSDLGQQNKTLLFDLDERYLTHKDAQEMYVPRREHEQRQRENKTRALQWPVIVAAVGGWLTNIVLLFTHAH